MLNFIQSRPIGMLNKEHVSVSEYCFYNASFVQTIWLNDHDTSARGFE